jgi:hypothetical protein
MTTATQPRLKARYNNTIKQQLAKDLGINNEMQIPKLEKIVINMGVGRATQQPSLLEKAVDDLTSISGQKPIITFEASIGMSLSMIPACWFALRGRWCLAAVLTPFTITLLSVGKTRCTTPSLPLSLPVITRTVSPFLSFTQITSGASETMRMNLRSRSSRPTGPKMRVPRGVRSSLISTAAFSSKRM